MGNVNEHVVFVKISLNKMDKKLLKMLPKKIKKY